MLATAEICGADVDGATLGSGELVFRPGKRRAGSYRFAIGSAGSTGLVLQTILPVLITAEGPSTLVIEGGTHNDHSPPYPFLERSFLPLLERMGPSIAITLDRHGFYPAGGGRITVQIEPVPQLAPLSLTERGEVARIGITALAANLAPNIAHRELVAACDGLGLERRSGTVANVDSDGPGNVVFAVCEAEHVTAVFTGFGRRGVRAEAVAQEVVDQVSRYVERGVPIDEHLADQLLLPLALAGAGELVTGPPTLHTTTNLAVIERFLGRRPRLEALGEGRVRITG